MCNLKKPEIFKFDGKITHAKMMKDPWISVKSCCNLLLYKELRLQRLDLAFRFDFFEIKAPASRRISYNSTSDKDLHLQMRNLIMTANIAGKCGLKRYTLTDGMRNLEREASMGTIIMGIDPGTRVVGYGVIELEKNDFKHIAHGAFDVRKQSYPQRLKGIYEGLVEAIDKYKPDVCVVEEIFFARSAKSAIKTGEGRGVALLAPVVRGVPVVEYAATKIKKSVTGAGGAHKSQVQKMVRLQLNLKTEPSPPDASDALACAICHGHRLRFEKRGLK